jgi:hypothetical protein
VAARVVPLKLQWPRSRRRDMGVCVTIASGGSCVLCLRKASAWHDCGLTFWPSVLHLPCLSWHWAGYLNRQRASRVLRDSWFGSKCGTDGGEEKYSVLVGNRKKICHIENMSVDKRIILEWVLKKWGRKAWTGVVVLIRQGLLRGPVLRGVSELVNYGS